MLKLDLCKKIHHEFVDKMYERCGNPEHPSYCEFDLRPMIFPEAGIKINTTEQSIIYIKVKNPREKAVLGINDRVVDFTCHETGHFLHPALRRWCTEENISGRHRTLKNHYLGELVANLSAIIFLSENYGDNRVERYLCDNHRCHLVLVAHDLYRNNLEILKQISDCEIRKASRLIKPFLDRDLYPKRLSWSYFGIYNHLKKKARQM